MKGRYTMAPGYSYGNSYDWSSIMGNPYFQYAYNSPNINFKGNSTESSQLSGADALAAAAAAQAQSQNTGAIPVIDNTTVQQDNSSIGTVAAIGGTILAAGGVLWALKSRKGSQVVKSIKSLFGGKSASSSGMEAISKLTAVKHGSGIKFLVPNKTVSKTDKQIQPLIDEYGIKTAISAERQAFNPTASALEGFRVEIDGNKYVVYTKDGSITKVVDEIAENITQRLTDAEAKSADANLLEQIKKIAQEFGKDAKDVEKTIFKGVTDIRYTNTFGDDVLKMTAAGYGEVPKLRQFTTLERFDFSSPEVQALKLASGEKVFADSKFYKDGKLIDGLTVSRFTDEIKGSGGCKGNFEGEELVSIIKPDGTVLPKDSAGYEDVVNRCQKEIDKMIRNVFYDRKSIPDGAVIVSC